MMNQRSPETNDRNSLESSAFDKKSLDLKGFEKYRYDPMMSMKHKDVKDNVEKVMISKFVEKA